LQTFKASSDLIWNVIAEYIKKKVGPIGLILKETGKKSI